MNLPIPTFGTLFVIAGFAVLWLFRKELLRLEAVGKLPTQAKDKTHSTFKPLSALAGEGGFITMISGMLGARLFFIVEHPLAFIADPWGMLTSRGGLAILGGFTFGALTGMLYLKRKGFPLLITLDAAAPALMFGFAIGRIGCQISGDGDWGIPANMSLKPDWLPTWFWAQTFTNNVLGQVIAPPGVYPTSVYESLMAFLSALLLWFLRKRPHSPGWLFSLMLVVGGIQRFFVEMIRINIHYSLFGLYFSQAQMIVTFFGLLGVLGLILTWRPQGT